MKTTSRLVNLVVFIFVVTANDLYAQHHKKKISLRDSLDHAIDLSDYIIDAHGFIPVPYVVTEPALGGFGLAVVPIFIKKNPPYLDSINGQLHHTPVSPDITGAVAAYTANKTWALAGFRSGTIVKQRIKYIIAGAYAKVNMSFYRTFDLLGEKELKFNFKAIPLFLQMTKRIGYTQWYAGFRYLYLHTDIAYVGDKSLASQARPFEFKSTVSQLGGIAEFDNRDNIFTPNKGMKLHFDANCANQMIGSDFNFWRLNYYMYAYSKLFPSVTGGLRVDGQQAFSDPPFFLLPYIDMRGIPANRYQGNADILTEGELRWDFVTRWSLMLFSGVGKAFDKWKDFGSADWIASYGTGFRYLLARKLKLRVGIDFARGKDDWAYYIVFGSNWLK